MKKILSTAVVLAALSAPALAADVTTLDPNAPVMAQGALGGASAQYILYLIALGLFAGGINSSGT